MLHVKGLCTLYCTRSGGGGGAMVVKRLGNRRGLTGWAKGGIQAGESSLWRGRSCTEYCYYYGNAGRILVRSPQRGFSTVGLLIARGAGTRRGYNALWSQRQNVGRRDPCRWVLGRKYHMSTSGGALLKEDEGMESDNGNVYKSATSATSSKMLPSDFLRETTNESIEDKQDYDPLDSVCYDPLDSDSVAVKKSAFDLIKSSLNGRRYKGTDEDQAALFVSHQRTIRAAELAKNYELIIKTFVELQLDGLSPGSTEYNNVIQATAEHYEDLDMVLEYYQRLYAHGCYLTDAGFNGILKLLMYRNPKEALTFFYDVREVAKQQQSSGSTSPSSLIMPSVLEEDDLSVETLLKEETTGGIEQDSLHNENTYAKLKFNVVTFELLLNACAFLPERQSETAMELIELAKQDLGESKSSAFLFRLLNQLVKVHWHTGNYDIALKVLKDEIIAKRLTVAPDILYPFLSKAEQGEKIDDVIFFLKMIDDRRLPLTHGVMLDIANMSYRQGSLELADRLRLYMNRSRIGDVEYISEAFAGVYFKNFLFDEGYETLSRLFRSGKDINSASVYSMLSNSFWSGLEVKMAVELLYENPYDRRAVRVISQALLKIAKGFESDLYFDLVLWSINRDHRALTPETIKDLSSVCKDLVYLGVSGSSTLSNEMVPEDEDEDIFGEVDQDEDEREQDGYWGDGSGIDTLIESEVQLDLSRQYQQCMKTFSEAFIAGQNDENKVNHDQQLIALELQKLACWFVNVCVDEEGEEEVVDYIVTSALEPLADMQLIDANVVKEVWKTLQPLLENERLSGTRSSNLDSLRSWLMENIKLDKSNGSVEEQEKMVKKWLRME
eukprot:Nk52_evm3s150 gene=Nk52_evmTU3s150